MSKSDGNKKNKKVLIFTALLVIGFLAFCTPRDKEDELLIDLLGMEKGGYIVEGVYVFSEDDKNTKFEDYVVKRAIRPVDEKLSKAIMEQIEGYTATRSIIEPPSKREGYKLVLDGYETKELWLFYSEEEQGYLIRETETETYKRPILIKESKLFEIIDEAYKNSVLR